MTHPYKSAPTLAPAVTKPQDLLPLVEPLYLTQLSESSSALRARSHRKLSKRQLVERDLLTKGGEEPSLRFNERTIVYVRRINDRQVAFWCPFCQEVHRHGSANLGGRSAHCSRLLSPLTHYILKLADPAEAAVIDADWREHALIAKNRAELMARIQARKSEAVHAVSIQ